MHELTLEQQFELQNLREASRLILIKTNVIQSLIRHNPLTPVE